MQRLTTSIRLSRQRKERARNIEEVETEKEMSDAEDILDEISTKILHRCYNSVEQSTRNSLRMRPGENRKLKEEISSRLNLFK